MRATFWALVLLQVLLLAAIIGYRHYWLATGERVLLRTVPVDPRDIFRGDYVRLSYDISSLDLDRLEGEDKFVKNESVYVVLRKNADDTYFPAATLDAPPRGERFIRGRVISRSEGNRWEVTVRDASGRQHSLEPRWFSYRKGERLFFCLNGRNEVISFGNHSGCSDPHWQSMAATVEDVKEVRFNKLNVEYGIESYFVEEGKGKALETARNTRDLLVEIALRRDGEGLITGLFMDGRRLE
jgi:uncharacterized membrane-anchored protein